MSNSHDPARRAVDINLALLRRVAGRIGTLREKVMFLGGTIVPLLVSGPAASDIRVAKDVDLMIHAPTKAELWAIEDELWDLGMKKKSTGAACHWRFDDVHVDVLTTNPDSIDLVNHWGREAMQHARTHDIGDGLLINVVRSTHYMAIKFDAFQRRGNGSYGTSLDIFDIRLVLRGCPDIDHDLQYTSPELRSHLVGELEKLFSSTDPGAGEAKDAGESLMALPDLTTHQNVSSILKV